MTESQSRDQALEQIAGIWARRKWLAAGVFVLAFVPATALLWSLPKIYEASAILVPAGASDAVPADLAAADPGGSLDAVTEEVLSRGNLMALIDRLGLFAAERRKLSDDVLTEGMRKSISVERKQSSERGSSQTFAFTVSYRGQDPATVAAVANALAHSYQSVAASMQTRDTSEAVRALESRLSVIQEKLGAQQKEIDAFRSEHLGELPEQEQINLAGLQRADAQLRDNQADQISALQRRAALVRQMGDSGEAELPQLEQKLAALRLRYTDEYPDVQQLKAQIEALRRQQASGTGGPRDAAPLHRQLEDVDAELAALKKQETQLRGQVAEYQRRLEDLPVTQQKLQDLTRGYGETSEVYAALLKRYEQARVTDATAGKDGPQYAILEAAVVPATAAGPSKSKFLLAALVLCLGAGFGMAILAEKRDTSFHTLDDLRRFTVVPVLTTVPFIRTRRDSYRRWLRATAFALAVVGAAGVLGAGFYHFGHGNTALTQMLSHHG